MASRNTGSNTDTPLTFSVGVIEVVTGLPLDVYLRRRILEPLGMIDTTYAVSAVQSERLAKGLRAQREQALTPVNVASRRDRRGTEELSGRRRRHCFQPWMISRVLVKCSAMAASWPERGSSGPHKSVALMGANHLTGLAVPFHNLGVGHGFGLVGVAMRR